MVPGNILDLFLTSETDWVGDVEVLASFPRCGHSPIICEYLFNFDIDADVDDVVQQTYLWHRGDYCHMSIALSGLNWELELMHLPADVAYKLFLYILKGLIDITHMREQRHNSKIGVFMLLGYSQKIMLFFSTSC